jgi:hypothetical protein
MNVKKYLIILMVLTITFLVGQAQNSLTLTNRSTTTFEMTAILTAGNHTETVIDNTQWMNYTYNWNWPDPYATVSVAIASGSIPTGMEIYIQAANYSGTGHGKAGKPTGKIKLSNIPTDLIYQIGDVNTGHGKRQGHQITLSILIVDYALVQPGNYTLNLLYTLSQ